MIACFSPNAAPLRFRQTSPHFLAEPLSRSADAVHRRGSRLKVSIADLKFDWPFAKRPLASAFLAAAPGQENGVSVIMVKCPNTGRELSTGIETDQAGFDRLPRMLTYSRCPLCRLEHAWWKREAWLAESDSSEAATDTAA
jgi:hypothetical protein